ncbi:MAG TPA: STAS domain-containing protein [Terriglobales bacterium]|nr:STAS domain-containing protein [Terriglobales bacterium]
MEILTQRAGDAVEVKVRGRLDNYWTEHLRSNLEELIRSGAHRLRLNLSEVPYLSSAGIGLLMQFYNQLKGIGGSLVVTNPSDRAKLILDLCKLSPILLAESAPVAAPHHKAEIRRFSSPLASYEVLEYDLQTPLICQRIGDPRLLQACRFGPQDCKTVEFPSGSFGLGLGAFGHDFEDSQARFGEFLAVGGSAAYLPTDGTNVPDFMVASGELVPEMNVLYGLRCEGGFSHLMRFESAAAEGPVPLAELVRASLEVAGAQAIGMAMVAESAGLVGAALRRSPAAAAGFEPNPFKYPEIRTWLSFSPERLYSRSLVLLCGIAAGSECAPMAALLRPMGAEGSPQGHFHAAAFSYRPLKKGEIDLKATATTLFETESLQGVLHLLADDRETAGPHQSEFVRGACWIAAISDIQ